MISRGRYKHIMLLSMDLEPKGEHKRNRIPYIHTMDIEYDTKKGTFKTYVRKGMIPIQDGTLREFKMNRIPLWYHKRVLRLLREIEPATYKIR